MGERLEKWKNIINEQVSQAVFREKRAVLSPADKDSEVIEKLGIAEVLTYVVEQANTRTDKTGTNLYKRLKAFANSDTDRFYLTRRDDVFQITDDTNTPALLVRIDHCPLLDKNGLPRKPSLLGLRKTSEEIAHFARPLKDNDPARVFGYKNELIKDKKGFAEVLIKFIFTNERFLSHVSHTTTDHYEFSRFSPYFKKAQVDTIYIVCKFARKV
jgi:hypothetical protein